ncbi:hypothetical protein LJ707_18445 [Mucilaginibacter sp. UR6-1]|uniref:hypothetical protein n=1 Tax=Mucilaginibacter sp. UR6-1 TaxID=1435643 RepID=UPI001E3B6480|nr:hypothetical protein [Mucilaginibacter sp. UR6-1]MCC8410926.1 hypothetical protein [Mucilaginibacter sp. UR6-1]
MKSTFLTLSLIVSVLFANAQKSVLLKLKYLPSRNYLSNIQIKMNMQMDFEGDSASLDKIKSSGTKIPIVMDMTTDMETLMKTKGKSTNTGLPFTLNYNKADVIATMNGTPVPIPLSQLKNQKLYGRCTNDYVLQIDSMPGKKADEAMKAQLAKMLNDLTSQIKFPEKSIAIGESFSMEVPMSIPANDNNMEMMVKMTYKLTDIKNGIAYCDLLSEVSADMNVKQSVMKMKGNGSGKMQYSIKDNFFTTMNQNFNYSYSMDINQIIMKGQAKMSSIYTVKITNNVN